MVAFGCANFHFSKAPYLASPAGLESQKKLWNETLEDIKPYVAVPPVFAKMAE